MPLRKAAVVHTSIHAPPRRVYEYLCDLRNWPRFAPWIRSVRTTSGGGGTFETDDGPMHLRFGAANAFGILDHHVTTASGSEIYNPLRVIANGDGSELVFVLFQAESVSDDEFAADRKAVERDLARIRKLLES